MRKLLLAVGLVATLGASSGAFAQAPADGVYSKDVTVSNLRGSAPVETGLRERAAHAAAQRASRLESRRWSGVSPARPPFYAGAGAGMAYLDFTPWHYRTPYRYSDVDWSR